MRRSITYNISSKYDGVTIERMLRGELFSKQSLVEIKKSENNLVLDGRWVHMSHVLKAGDVLTVNIYEEQQEESAYLPVKLSLDIVYEDEDIIVVDKPVDMPVHPSRNNQDNTLANALAYYFKEKSVDFTFRCINRLDRDTSGLVLLAKHYVSAGILSQAMQKREIKREYHALVQGLLEEKAATIDLPIGRIDDVGIKRFVDFENGEKAITHYEVVAEGIDALEGFYGKEYPRVNCPDEVSLVAFHLDTGRTHQIRVHMSHIGHPLIGDKLYNNSFCDEYAVKYQALRSCKLSFVHPITKEHMIFVAK